MNKEEFIKQRCEIDKITEEEFKKQYRVVKCNCGYPFYNGYRCLDLDDLLKECINYENQQKEFINYLEEKIKYFKDLEQFAIKIFNNKAVINLDLIKRNIEEDNLLICNFEESLQKYKEIIGYDK